ncbi:6,7-dimethyl-8-ribityllumazine synthase [Devosia neptuniae]|jgi:6,7-dimethyl-8-ribityllumazine synthase|uniref:6,7-dimethyl-8-ribityllumazine synthase n=1 Tax=Devosia TaxID=46913 RepID=UPI0022AEF47B|nr:6,7-dimethyl-8-ribityllumazine synthase [Devosia neptuniae]MCZ4346812.1 6,7-dimethyl-8-ribityllumazine synthase [Devosia neptuniae]|tara:strand:+ start:4572 stop:5048 length:477 start_codon:yes stop_codon:yes gene_type:complete
MTNIIASQDSRIAIVVSRFNQDVTDGLLWGARACLAEHGIALAETDVLSAPGAFEIPLIAQALAKSGQFDGVICLGCVIKGDTAHFDYISQAASSGLMAASLSTGVPLSFGILTTYTDEQAAVRSRDDVHNKGREAALACLEAIHTLAAINHFSGAAR